MGVFRMAAAYHLVSVRAASDVGAQRRRTKAGIDGRLDDAISNLTQEENRWRRKKFPPAELGGCAS
jgi:hypothetical protein